MIIDIQLCESRLSDRASGRLLQAIGRAKKRRGHIS